jgi:16S rRNA C967 or C1407 C5-methylase (RsmB/RsmF family)/NOL1/NOP2/fmu family ribosome biogenesis protein
MLTVPNIFLQRIKNILGNELDSFVDALHQEPVTSLRKNPDKFSTNESREKVAWCDTGFYLPQRSIFTLDPDFHAGAYYVQEASSMFLEQVVKQHIGNRNKIIALDLCAAPGGKSTHLLSLLPENSLLVANEVIRSRVKILYENIIKWGKSNVALTNNSPKDFSALTDFFDIILVDAPCSGEGMFRKDSNAAKEWSVNNVKLCSERQRRILADIWNALKPDGLLVYCTCTYNVEENEENIKWITKNFSSTSLPVKIQAEWGISENLIPQIFSYRFYPHKTKGEGFCISVLQKTSNTTHVYKKQENKNQKNIPKNMDFIKTYLLDAEKYHFFENNNVLKAISNEISNEINIIQSRFNCLYSGTMLGTVKGDDFVPAHALALSANFNRQIFPQVEIDKNHALKFLHKDNVCYPTVNTGYNLVCHNNNALGWIKNIGNRINNLYPHEWRILMDLNTKKECLIV